MSENLWSYVPACLKSPDVLIGESSNSVIVGYEKSRIVAKCDRDGRERVYSSLGAALARICREQQERRLIRQELQHLNCSPELVPHIDVILHEGRSGEISYSEVQKWYRGSRTLTQAGLNVLSAPIDALEDIQMIFAASIHHYIKTGDLYDTQGTMHGENTFQKAVSAFFPLFYSTNILFDHENNVRFFDATILKGRNLPARKKLHRLIDVLGTVVSIGMINVVVTVRTFVKLLRLCEDP